MWRAAPSAAKIHYRSTAEAIDRMRVALGEHGERFIITRDGEDKAEIGPVDEAANRRARQAADAIRQLRKNIQPLGIPLKEAIEDGRA